MVLARRGSKSFAEFFVGGRAIPWWLAGASMAATTFNVDTPLYVTGVVARRGIAGNWEWWSFAFTHVLMAVVLARLWRRATIMTDAELIELRYGGKPAAILRGTRALLFAIPINCLGIGYGMLAMRKVLVALGAMSALPLPGDPQLWAVVAIVLVVLVYSAAAGLWGVVATDFLQLGLALLGAMLVAGYALHEVGGLGALRERLVQLGHADTLRLLPRPGDLALPFGTFLGYIGIQWWAYRGADGGGMFVQRLSSVKDERAAERAAGLFNVINYVVRTWPWVVVALAALVVLPGLKDPETAYPLMMLHYLPVGVLGLVVGLVGRRLHVGRLDPDQLGRLVHRARRVPAIRGEGRRGAATRAGGPWRDAADHAALGGGELRHARRGQDLPVPDPDRQRLRDGAAAALVLVAGERVGGMGRAAGGAPDRAARHVRAGPRATWDSGPSWR